MLGEAMNVVFHVWFGCWALVGLILNWTGCVIIYAVCDTIESKQKYCCMVCHWAFRWFFIKPCPWIRVSAPPYEEMVRLMDRDKVFLMMNHTSFWDSVLFVGTTPPNIIWRYRTLMKYKLFDVSIDYCIAAVYELFFSSSKVKRNPAGLLISIG